MKYHFKRTWICCLCFGIIFFIACQKDNGDPTPSNPTTGVRVIEPDGSEPYLNLNSDYIFNQEQLRTYELILPESNLEKIDRDPTAEKYVEAMLVHQGDTVSPVGVRYKGSVGAFVGCVSGSDWANPSGRKTCTKLSMKVKINWNGRQDHFYGLKKLQFHSQNQDDSQMRERLGYWLFREMGVRAPRSVHARLIINGEYVGLFALTEQIDGRFTRYNFQDGKGNLYKEVWPLKMNGQPHSDQTYLAGLKTNEDDMPQIDLIKGFAHALANADQSEVPELISNAMNIEEVMAYCAVDRTIRHDDGPFHWYCGNGGCGNHNFYWYEETNAGKLHLIPWDLDNAFENIMFNANPVTPIADSWGQISNNCQPFNYGAWRLRQWSAACDKLTQGWVSNDDLFEQMIAELKAGPLSEVSVEEQLTKWAEQITSATLEANQKHGDAISINRWQSGLNTLRTQLSFARNN